MTRNNRSCTGPGQARAAIDEIEAAIAAESAASRAELPVPDHTPFGDLALRVPGAGEPPD
jgi:hypothetical protein